MALFQRKIFAEHGKLDGGARSLEIVKGALKEAVIGENRQCRRAPLTVSGRDSSRVEIGRQQPATGRCFLNLGNNRGRFGLEGAAEIASVCSIGRRSLPLSP